MSQQHTYTSLYPSSFTQEEEIKTFFENFYKLSDTPDAHVQYKDCFTGDAELVMGIKRVRGADEILAFRVSMWEKVKSRLHTIKKVFPFGEGAREFMLFGVVEYVLKDGKKADVEWAARAQLTKEDENWKMSFYQVYLDSAAIQNAK